MFKKSKLPITTVVRHLNHSTRIPIYHLDTSTLKTRSDLNDIHTHIIQLSSKYVVSPRGVIYPVVTIAFILARLNGARGASIRHARRLGPLLYPLQVQIAWRSNFKMPALEWSQLILDF